MMTILAQRKSYVEVERMWDQQKILQQCLGPLQEEALKVIGELETMQGKVKQATHETEENIMSLTVQGVEEIVETEETIIKEVATAKEASQKFIQAWRSMQQA
jgi:6-phosphogluconate dehydrogenase (decarboxylating)